jgi:hypothetical protein
VLDIHSTPRRRHHDTESVCQTNKYGRRQERILELDLVGREIRVLDINKRLRKTLSASQIDSIANEPKNHLKVQRGIQRLSRLFIPPFPLDYYLIVPSSLWPTTHPISSSEEFLWLMHLLEFRRRGEFPYDLCRQPEVSLLVLHILDVNNPRSCCIFRAYYLTFENASQRKQFDDLARDLQVTVSGAAAVEEKDEVCLSLQENGRPYHCLCRWLMSLRMHSSM